MLHHHKFPFSLFAKKKTEKHVLPKELKKVRNKDQLVNSYLLNRKLSLVWEEVLAPLVEYKFQLQIAAQAASYFKDLQTLIEECFAIAPSGNKIAFVSSLIAQSFRNITSSIFDVEFNKTGYTKYSKEIQEQIVAIELDYKLKAIMINVALAFNRSFHTFLEKEISREGNGDQRLSVMDCLKSCINNYAQECCKKGSENTSEQYGSEVGRSSRVNHHHSLQSDYQSSDFSKSPKP